jgi:Protein of unknown function (DUF3619)
MNEEQFLQKIRAELDASEQALDAATLSRLNQARQKALAQGKKPAWIIWVPAAATASVVAALIGGNLLIQKPDIEPNGQAVAFEDIELLTSDADLDLLQEMDMLEVVADDAS